MNKTFRLSIVAIMVGMFMLSSPVSANVACNTYTYTGDDDSAFAANLPFSLKLGQVDYSNVYVSTNGTLTFGRADGTYWDYPQTPSVSVAGYDWVTFGQGAYLSFGSTANTFCAEWSVRPFPQSTGELTQIRLIINRADDGGWHGEIVTFGWLPDNVRRGIRFEQGQPVVPMEAAFDVNGGVPIEVPPAPTPSSFTQEPIVPSPTPSASEPQPPVEPIVSPEPTPSPTLEPSPQPSATPEPTATETTQATPLPTPSESPITSTPEPTIPVTPEPVTTPEPTPLTIPSQSPVVIASETPLPIVSPSPDLIVPINDLEVGDITLPAIFNDVPFAASVEAFLNIGNDMTPEEREASQGVIVSAVILTQIVQQGRKIK
jgi:hypothetical protein